MADAADSDRVIEAHGGMTEFYRAANSRYQQAELLSEGYSVSAEDRACATKNIVTQLQMLHAYCLNGIAVSQALVVREAIEHQLELLRQSLDEWHRQSKAPKV